MTAELTHSLIVLGKLTFAPTDPVLPFGTYVIQRVEPGTGNVTADPTLSLQIRRHVIPVDPNTPAQQSNRAKVRAAVASWHTLDATTKQAWKVRGAPRHITGFNAYLSDWLLNAAPVVPLELLAHGMRAPMRPPALYVVLPPGPAHRGHIKHQDHPTKPPPDRGTPRATIHAAAKQLATGPSANRGTPAAHIRPGRMLLTVAPTAARGALPSHQLHRPPHNP